MNKILSAIAIAGILISVVVISGCTGTGNFLNICKSSCDQTFDRCNYNCGSGLLAGFCRADCTNQHNNCLQSC